MRNGIPSLPIASDGNPLRLPPSWRLRSEPPSPDLSITVMPYYTQHGLDSVRVAQSASDLKSASWQSASGSVSYTINPAQTVNGMATIYVQAKDTMGNLSSPISHEVPYGFPVISDINLVEGRVFSGSDAYYDFNWNQYDAGQIQQEELLLNGLRVWGNAGTWDMGDGRAPTALGCSTWPQEATPLPSALLTVWGT